MIKKLILRNFKSFQNAEIILLNRNVLIGPNGSGKSNICDAIKFLLGEKSLQELRAKSSLDLIYRNAKEGSVKGILNDGTEIERVVRDDGSLYYINGKKVSYQEYLDFLIRNNLGNSYRFFIMQGQIDKIISMYKKDKLELFQDGAGIQQFELRKVEALKEIEFVEQRINQIAILVGEKTNMLNIFKEQAEKAMQYQNIKNRIDLLYNSVNRKKYEQKLKILEKLKNEYDSVSKDFEKVKEQYLSVKNKVDQIYSEKQMLTSKLTSSEIGKLIAELEEQKNILEKEKAELLSLERILYERNKYLQSAIAKRQELQRDIINLENVLKQDNYGSLEDKIKEINTINEDLLNIENQLLNLKIKYKEYEKITKNIEDLNKIKLEISNINNQIISYYKKDSELLSLLKSKNSEISNLKEQYGSLKTPSSKAFLDEIVKTIKDDGIYDLVINLIEFDPKLSEAVDSLGNRLLNLVVRDVEVAKRISSVIKNYKIRLTVLPLENLNVQSPKNVDIGYGLLKNHISIDPKFEKILDYVFGDIVLVKDFDEAKKYIGKYRMVTLAGEFFDVSGAITLGSGSGISSARSAGIILQKINELEKEIEEINNQREKLQEEIQKLRERKAILESKLEINQMASEIDINEIISKISELEKKKDVLIKKKEELSSFESIRDKIEEFASKRKELEIKKAQLKEIEDGIKYLNEEIQKLQLEIRSKSDSIRINELRISQKKREYQEKDNEIREMMRLSSEKENELKTYGLELQKISEKMTNFEKHLLKLENEIKLKEQELASINYDKEKEFLDLPIEDMEKEISELQNNLIALGNINFAALEQYENLKKDLDEVNSKLDKLRQEKESLVRFIHELDAKKHLTFKEFIDKVNDKLKDYTSRIPGFGIGKIWYDGDIHIELIRDGKSIRLESLSGGEKSLLALLIIFSMNSINPIPITVFDEVDAPLDKMNVERMKEFIIQESKTTQFIIVTHNSLMMDIGENIIGVSKVGNSSKVAQIKN